MFRVSQLIVSMNSPQMKGQRFRKRHCTHHAKRFPPPPIAYTVHGVLENYVTFMRFVDNFLTNGERWLKFKVTGS